MRKIYFFYVFIPLIILFCLSTTRSAAQEKTYEEIVAEMQKEFEDFAAKNEETFNAFVEKNEKEFSEHLRKAWDAYQANKAMEPPQDPKPVEPPKVEPIEIEKDEPVTIPVDEEPILTAKAPEADRNPVRPNIKKKEADLSDAQKGSANFMFYGIRINLSYDKAMLSATRLPARISGNAIADYWDRMSKTKHYHLLDQLASYRTGMNLNDWGYYLLLKNTAEQLFPQSDNKQNLFIWYLLCKSRYRAKVGYNDDNVFLLLPSENTLYGRKYYKIDGINYYLIGKRAGQLYSYRQDYPDAIKLMNMNIYSAVHVGTKINNKQLNFSYNGDSYVFPVKYNADLIQFYDDYPQADIKIYFDAAVSRETKESLIKSLRPVVENKEELEAVNFLLSFVQNAFSYKTDQQQFNREKFFFPEEVFHYPYCDCEDRSVLFAYLVKELLGLKVVGLGYPGHMATAVRFSEDHHYDHFIYKGDKYIICDPTYINAPVGMCMPEFENSKAKIVEMENLQNRESIRRKIWQKAMEAGCYRGGNYDDIVFDHNGNSYIAGFFSGIVQLGGKQLKSTDGTNDVFIAKFDKQQNLEWLKQAGGKGEDIAYAIGLDKDNNVFVTGAFDKDISFGGNTIKSNGVKDIFITRLTNNGAFRWANKLSIENPNLSSDYVCVSKFDPSGKELTTMMFDETEDFQNYGIAFDSEGNCYVTISFTATRDEGMTAANYDAMRGFSFPSYWKTKNDQLLQKDYVSPMAGLFAFVNTIRNNGTSVSGKIIQETLDTYNPSFKKASPTVYNNIGKITFIKNSAGIITIKTTTGQDVTFSPVVIKNNAKIKVTTFSGGNAQVNILSGVNFGKSLLAFSLNHVKMDKRTGNLIFDYDNDHLIKQLSLENDILR